MATIRDIAQAAGVSTSTVSRVLKGDSSLSVSPETRERVMDAAIAANYTTSVPKHTDIVGNIAIVSWHNNQPKLSDLYFHSLNWGAETALKAANYSVTQLIFNDSLIELKKADGIIAIGDYTSEELQQLKQYNLPLVVLNHDSLADDISCVVADYGYSVDTVLDYFITQGKKRVALITGQSKHHHNLEDPRTKHYRRYMTTHGIYDDTLVFVGDFTPQSGYTVMSNILNQTGTVLPDAFFATSDTMAIGALKALSEHHIKVPEDVELIGFGDLDISQYTVPSLSTVQLATRQMGESGVLLLEAVMHGIIIKPVKLVTSNTLILRDSTN